MVHFTTALTLLGSAALSRANPLPHQAAVRQASESATATAFPVKDVIPTAAVVPGEEPNTIKGAYILQLKPDAVVSDDFVAHIEAELGVSATLRTNLTGPIFKGLSLQLDGDTKALAKLESLAEVEAVSAVHTYTKPTILINQTFPDVPADRRRQVPIQLDGSDPYHEATQVNQMHRAGYTGKGIRVGVIGTPLDTDNPYLTISFGTSFLEADDPPYGPGCNIDELQHDTACAGIIGMKKTPYGFKGVAPDAEIGSYAIAGCKHGPSDEKLLAALNKAVADGVHIISYSWGFENAWSNIPLNAALNAVIQKGIFLSGAAGNSGPNGLFSVINPATADNVFASGSVDAPFGIVMANHSSWTSNNGNSGKFGWRDGEAPGAVGWGNTKLPLYMNIEANGGCKDLPSNHPDLSKHIVLMRRPGCSDYDLGAYAARAGAKYVIIADDNREGKIELPRIEATGLRALAMVDLYTAGNWTDLLKAGRQVTVDMTKGEFAYPLVEDVKKTTKISGFSSWGPTNDAMAANAIVSPGGNMFTVVPPRTGNTFTTASGTSFAAPYSAGVAALVAQARGTQDWSELYSRLATTGKSLLRDNDDKEDPKLELATTAHQGGGLIQAYAAAFVPAVVDKTHIDFNDTVHRRELSFTVTSMAKTAITYRVSNRPAGTVYGLAKGKRTPASYDEIRDQTYLDARGLTAGLLFSSQSFTLAPGAKTTLRVQASDPLFMDVKRMAVWSGWVVLTGSDGSELKVAYMGIAGDLGVDVPRLADIMVRMVDPDAKEGEEPRPIVDPSRLIRLPEEVIVLHLSFGFSARKTHLFAVDQATGREVGRLDVGDFGDSARTMPLVDWRGELADDAGTIKAGTYKLIGKVLKVFGDASKPEDWVKHTESTVFRVA